MKVTTKATLDAKMVAYEFDGVRDSKRAKAELGDLILRNKVVFQSSFTMGTDWDRILRMKPEDLSDVVEKLKPWKYMYRSPTYFCGSCICPIYASAEDELAGTLCEGYVRHYEGGCSCQNSP